MRDYYKVLGVPRNISQEELKAAYRRLVKQYHPDQNSKDPVATDMMKMINEAYSVVGDPHERKRYDQLRSEPVHETSINQQTYSTENFRTVIGFDWMKFALHFVFGLIVGFFVVLFYLHGLLLTAPIIVVVICVVFGFLGGMLGDKLWSWLFGLGSSFRE